MDGTMVASCSTAGDAVVRASHAINEFVREVRESRSEFDIISTELHSLDSVLGLLNYDAPFFPSPLAEHTPGVLDICLALINELEGCISLLNQPGVSRADKKSRWLASRDHVGTLRWTLSRYKLVLGLAADLVGVTKSQERDQAEQGRVASQQDTPCGNDASEDSELTTVVTRIIEVAQDLEEDLQQSVALSRLGQYLHVLQAQALNARRRDRSSSMGGAPDSAIDVSYDDIERTALPLGKQTTLPLQMSTPGKLWEEEWEEERDEFVGELSEMPIQAPPLPARSTSRLGSASARRSPSRRSSTADSYSGASSTTALNSPGISNFSTPHQVTPQRPIREDYCTPVTELSEQMRHFPPRSETRTHSRRSSLFGQVLYSVWENPRPDVPSPTRPATSSGEMQQADRQPGLFRRRGSKLSTAFRSLGLRQPSLKTVDDDPGLDSIAVFGVPLATSIQVAKGVASTRHGSGESSTRATREYPLCVLRCVYHIRECGLDTPQLFGDDGDESRVAQLKEVFGSLETNYGKELDWSLFTVHDAADLVLLFLSELSKPIIPESVGKRWIALSRQAIIGGGRPEQGLDFWEEALMGIRGPGRPLFKLLLNLWGDIADAAEVNKMTAEHLADRAIRPLMHASATRRHADFMLGLAFLIRKRSEYSLAARGVTGKSNAAF
ncbi:hypothetical protein C8A00DRAFT_46135 [Chaetomidium leptoderma]|uniref:Rho-GAP domain-containing protein n=1 Tax=Chaetomidium leptoderma TaxID=669021 RepID=A0AAN6VFR7_9PEZI|nr:hypothetical protein C8A00DRAFT_46135 [Chaetomidium leptoderma]